MDEFNFYNPYDPEIIAIKEKCSRIKKELQSIILNFGKYKGYNLWFLADYPITNLNSTIRDYLYWAIKNTPQLKRIVIGMSEESRNYFLNRIKKSQYEKFNLN